MVLRSECDSGEYTDRFARALYDAETLSRLPHDELRDVFDRLAPRRF